MHIPVTTLIMGTITLLSVSFSHLQAQTYNMPGGTTSTCTGSFFDTGGSGGNYANNEDTVSVFCPGNPAVYLKVDLTAVSLAGGDYLYIYDGSSTSDPLIASVTAACPTAVTSSVRGGCLAFRMVSDGASTSSGWSGTISCVDSSSAIFRMGEYGGTTVVACDGLFTDDGGAVCNYLDIAPRDEIMTFCPEDSARHLLFDFTAFSLAAGDELYIHDGADTTAALMRIQINACNPDSVMASLPGGCVTFRFITTGSSPGSGWSANVSCFTPGTDGNAHYSIGDRNDSLMVCSGKFYDDGGPNCNYYDLSPRDESITFCAENDSSYLRFVLSSFSMAAGDNLYVYDGPDTSYPLIRRHTAGCNPDTITSSKRGGCLTYRIITSGASTSNGWEADIQCFMANGGFINYYMGDRPDSIIIADKGGFFDDGGPGCNYEDTSPRDEIMTFCPDDPDEYLQIDFSDFSLAGGDFLYVYDGSSSTDPLMRTHTFSCLPSVITSTMPGQCITFRFTTTGASTSRGWEAQISSVKCDSAFLPVFSMGNFAGRKLSACKGVFTDDGGTGCNYQDLSARNDTLTICSADPTSFLMIDFNTFSNAAGDILFIYDGPDASSPLIGQYSNACVPDTVISSKAGGCLTFRFVTTGSSTAGGWTADIKCINDGRRIYHIGEYDSDTIFTCYGRFFDDGGRNCNYSDNADKTMTFCPETGGGSSRFTFTAWGMAAGDLLYVFDGASTSDPQVPGSPFSAVSPGTVTAAGPTGCLTFWFTSNGSSNWTGWAANISCTGSPPPLPPLTITETCPSVCALDASLSKTDVLCNGGSDGTATAAPLNGNPPFTYLWSDAASQTTATAGGLGPGTYNVTVTDSSGCTVSDIVSVGEPTALMLSLDSTSNACMGSSDGSVFLSGSGGTPGYTYQWPGGGNDSSATGLSGGSYTVTLTDNNGCTDTLTVSIAQEPLPSAEAGNYTMICETDSVQLSPGGGITYVWSPATGLSMYDPQLGNPWAGPSVTTTYTVTVSDGKCQATDTVTIGVTPVVNASAGPASSFCTGSGVQLVATGGNTYSWSPPTGLSDPNISNPFAGPAVTTAYRVIVGNGVCPDDTATVTVTVHPLPVADAGPDVTIPAGRTTLLSGSGGVSCVWSPGSGLNDSTICNPTAGPGQTTTYYLTVTDSNGCLGLDSMVVTVSTDIIIPEGISPNGDGLNDTWKLDFAPLFTGLRVEVYNRWGQLIFESDGYATEWDGTYRGSPLPVGTYYYVIKLNDTEDRSFSGPVVIMR